MAWHSVDPSALLKCCLQLWRDFCFKVKEDGKFLPSKGFWFYLQPSADVPAMFHVKGAACYYFSHFCYPDSDLAVKISLISINLIINLLLLSASQEITTLMTVKYDQGRLVLAINA